MEKYIVPLIVLALILSEAYLNINEDIGFVLYGFLIGVCLLYLSHLRSLKDYDGSLKSNGKLVIVFMIVPIVRITELFITLEFFWKVLISYGILLFLSFYYSARFELDHGHKKEKLGLLPLAIISGVVFGAIGNFSFGFEKYFWMVYLIPFISYSEEILFRGMMQNLLEKSYGIWASVFISALLYGIFSLGYGILFSVFIFFAGTAIGIIYSKTKNIFLAVAINMMMHLFLFVF